MGEIVPELPQLPMMKDQNLGWVDADLIGSSLKIRKPRPGDRFQPLGMESGTIKLSDFWVNQKIPRFARAKWPLVLSNDQILWIPGQRPAHFCRLTSHTDKIYSLRLIRQDKEKSRD